MFYHLEGKVTDIDINLVVLDCNGLGFALNATTNTISHVKMSEKIKLYIYENVREDAYDLFGFYSLAEKRSFEMLVSVSGVGPKAALSILSSSTPEGLAMAVIGGDEKALTVAQGIGKKIAQRIILELKDKMAKESGTVQSLTGGSAGGSVGTSKVSDAISALVVLGYTATEVNGALKSIDIENTRLEDIIRLALKSMVK